MQEVEAITRPLCPTRSVRPEPSAGAEPQVHPTVMVWIELVWRLIQNEFVAVTGAYTICAFFRRSLTCSSSTVTAF